jgi:hypothetical protein
MRAWACGVHRGLGMDKVEETAKIGEPPKGKLCSRLIRAAHRFPFRRDFGNLNLECFEAAGGWGLATVLTTTEAVNM